MRQKIKGAWKSWTIWFNGVASAIVLGLPMLQDSLPQLQPFLAASHYKWIMSSVIVGNILLRFKTNKALEHK